MLNRDSWFSAIRHNWIHACANARCRAIENSGAEDTETDCLTEDREVRPSRPTSTAQTQRGRHPEMAASRVTQRYASYATVKTNSGGRTRTCMDSRLKTATPAASAAKSGATASRTASHGDVRDCSTDNPLDRLLAAWDYLTDGDRLTLAEHAERLVAALRS